MKGNHATFGSKYRGRIEVERGTGAIELPNASQFAKIAEEEGISPRLAERAFGHMKGFKPPRDPEEVKSRKRKSSRKKPKSWLSAFGLTPNPIDKTKRYEYLYASHTLKGEPVEFIARPYYVNPEEWERRGYRVGIEVMVGGRSLIIPAADAQRRSARWFSGADFRKAFGHILKKKSVAAPSSRRLPTIYGPRSMRLGHWSGGTELDEHGHPIHAQGAHPIIGIQPGQLILVHKPSGAVVWQAFADPETPDAPIRIVAPGTRAKGFKEGKGNVVWGRGLALAKEREIPSIAYLDAFGFMLDKESRKTMYRSEMRERANLKRRQKTSG
ncbi:MAG: hypothetical protein DRH30_05405 [Deltaproteobacteria bacterium]|nr:MAG: hypothetical protein DRH30_05405 [Deltaproteobacteria bacterium]